MKNETGLGQTDTPNSIPKSFVPGREAADSAVALSQSIYELPWQMPWRGQVEAITTRMIQKRNTTTQPRATWCGVPEKRGRLKPEAPPPLTQSTGRLGRLYCFALLFSFLWVDGMGSVRLKASHLRVVQKPQGVTVALVGSSGKFKFTPIDAYKPQRAQFGLRRGTRRETGSGLSL